MRLLFIRHAEAEEAGHGVPGVDPDRRLTRKGRRDAKSVGRALEILRVRPRLVLSSPYVRAMETAELLSGELKKSPGVVPVKALEPEATWRDLQEEVARHGARLAGRCAEDTWVFVVGHQPNMGEMILSAMGGRGSLKLTKSGCVGIGWEDDKPGDSDAEICLALNLASVKKINASAELK